MRDIHVTRDLLAAVAAGTLPADRLVTVLSDHLATRCEPCRREIAAWQADHHGTAEIVAALGVLTAQLSAESPALEAAEAKVAAWIKELQTLEPRERIERVERASRRFRGTAFARAALDQSRKALPGKPVDSLAWAKCAEGALTKDRQTAVGLTLLARALSWSANARRAQQDLRSADLGFQAVRFLLEAGGITDTLALAEADTLEGSLRKDQRRFGEAEALLTRATDLYSAIAEPIEAEITRLKLASIANLQGQPKKAVSIVWQTLPVLTPDEHPRLHLMARFNLAWYYHHAGNHQGALEVLVYDEDVYDDWADRNLLLHRQWLEARIAFAMGDAELAEPLFRRVRTAFLRRKMALDVAAVSIDLALLLLKAGRLGEVKRIAREATALFEAQGIHREALAALLLFEEAAREERLTAAFLTRLASYLPQAAADPEFRFER